MDRLLVAEKNILDEEERFFGGQHNGSLLPNHWKTTKTADYLMLRSAVFKDIELNIQNNNENLFEEEKKTTETETKKSPVKVPIAKSVSKDLTEKEDAEKENDRWKTVFVDVNEEHRILAKF